MEHNNKNGRRAPRPNSQLAGHSLTPAARSAAEGQGVSILRQTMCEREICHARKIPLCRFQVSSPSTRNGPTATRHAPHAACRTAGRTVLLSGDSWVLPTGIPNHELPFIFLLLRMTRECVLGCLAPRRVGTSPDPV